MSALQTIAQYIDISRSAISKLVICDTSLTEKWVQRRATVHFAEASFFGNLKHIFADHQADGYVHACNKLVQIPNKKGS